MNIYKPIIANSYQFFETDSLEHLEMLQQRKYDAINSFSFTLANENRDTLGDITVIDNSMLLAFSKNAAIVFKTLGRFIPLPTFEDFFLFEPPIVDALDLNQSVIDYFPGTQQIKRIRKYKFIVDQVEKYDIFVLPIKGSPVFVTETFVDLYNTSKFKGLDFSLVFCD